MQIKDVARVSFSARRPVEGADLTAICNGVLAQIIINAEGIAMLFIHKIFGEGAAGIRCDILHRAPIGSRGNDDRCVIHWPYRLSISTISAMVDSFCPIATNADYIFVFLVYNGIESNRGFPCFPVADDKFPLTSAYRNHRIYTFNARLKRLLYGLPLCNSRGVCLNPAKGVRFNGRSASKADREN